MRRPKNEPYIYVRPDGAIEVRWTNPQTGRRVTRIARDNAHARRLLVSITAPSPPRQPRAPTLSEWVDRWLAMRLADGLDPDTAATYDRQLRRVVVPLRTHPLTAITPVLLAAASPPPPPRPASPAMPPPPSAPPDTCSNCVWVTP